MKNPEKIRKMFNDIASKYDFMNNIISFGLHKIIKQNALKKLEIKPYSKVIDLCCGTGDIPKMLSKNLNIKEIIGIDFSDKMLEIAKTKNSDKKIEYINSDCVNLPFEDKSFDIATMFFGLRNIENTDTAIKEVRRILKDSGEFMYMDFAKANKFFDFIFDTLTPFAAGIFSKNKEAYNYLINSKKVFYNVPELTNYMKDRGFELKNEFYFLFSTIICQIYTK